MLMVVVMVADLVIRHKKLPNTDMLCCISDMQCGLYETVNEKKNISGEY